MLKGLGLLAGIGLLIYAFSLWFRSDFWRVEKITCQLKGQDCSPELKAELMRLFQGLGIIFLSSDKAISEIKKTQFSLSKIEIRKHFPNELIFRLEERKPQAAVAVEGADQGEFYLVDQEGVLLEKVTVAPNLPLVFISRLPALEVGDQVNRPELNKTVAILIDIQLRLMKPRLARVVSEKETEIWVEDDIQARFSLEKDSKPQLDSLQLILTRAKIRGELPSRIDLRFDKPVIVYE